MSADGIWLCRACWKTNRATDARCYRCHTPRDADEATIEKSRGMDRAPAAPAGARGIVDVLVAVPAVVFSWFWWLIALGGILFVGVAILAATDGRSRPWIWIAWAVAAVGLFFVAYGMRWASRGMRDRNPWAFVTALVLSLAIGGFTVYALTALPPGTGNPNWMRYVMIAVFGSTALLAAIGFLLLPASEDAKKRPSSPN